MSKININSTSIHYTTVGKGRTLVFLHGFIESLAIWNFYAEKLADSFHVVCIDLPGHGESGNAKHAHTMDFMAEIVNSVLVHLKIDICVMIGHSMGGYVTLEFVKKFPNKLIAFCILHSHPFEDSDQKKSDRKKAIAIVERNPNLYISEMIPNLFANKDTSRFPKELSLLIHIAESMSKKGIIKALEGMIERKDNQRVIKDSDVPVLIVLGEKDNVMDFETLKIQTTLSEKIEPLTLKESGHLGFFEERDYLLSRLIDFINKSIC